MTQLIVRLAEAAGYLNAIGRNNASAAVLEAIEIIRAVPYGTDIHAALWNIQMEITIRAQPLFMIEFNGALTRALLECAETHYDSACKNTAAQGGILKRIEASLSNNGEPTVSRGLTWREMDLLRKVCEFPPPGLAQEERDARDDFFYSAGGALQLANEHYDKWIVTFKNNHGTL